MGSSNHHHLEMRKFDGTKPRQILVGLTILGAALSVFALMKNQVHFFQSFLISWAFFTTIACLALFFIATQYVTKARWSVNIRRIPEAFSSFIPVAGILGILFMLSGTIHHGEGHFGSAAIYHWMDKNLVSNDHLLLHKSGYLNFGGAIFRSVLIFGLFYFFRRLLVNNSLLQDRDGDPNRTVQNIKYSAIFLIIFSLGFAALSYDYLMSVEAHWFSTMFSVFIFASGFYSFLSLCALTVLYCYKKGFFGNYVSDEHIHDLTKFAYAMCIFWAYVAFSQFMLIWYAGIPEETFFYMDRWKGAWKCISIGLPILKFFIPFLVLMSRHMKRNYLIMAPTLMIVLFANLYEYYWIVYPSSGSKEAIFGIAEIGTFLFLAGLFGLCVVRFLTKNLIVPAKDPHREDSAHFMISP